MNSWSTDLIREPKDMTPAKNTPDPNIDIGIKISLLAWNALIAPIPNPANSPIPNPCSPP